jgi:two-component system LytT family response regulator
LKIQYLIVDDEALSRVNLRLAMNAYPEWALAAECESARSARALLSGQKVDVIFLDIQMPVESGLLLARYVSGLREPPLIIFVTAYSEHAIGAFELHALDYLLKPVSDARLAQAVERCAAMLRHRQREAYGAAMRDYVDAAAGQQAKYLEHVNVRSVGRIEQLRVDDVLLVESAGNYVELHLSTRAVLHRITLNRLESVLDPANFLRVHRSVLVRRDHIAALTTIANGNYRLTLRCGTAVPVSERYLNAVKAAM